ncbi:MAG: restriction endonuclease subunit S [Bacteroides sp.]|nr:restriction endonuclease subunit S [Bacteroides sp.]
MGEWKEYKLGDIISLGNGKVRPKDIGDIPVYGGNGILGYCNSSNYDGEIIVIGRVGAYCGSVYYENRPIWISDNALAAKSKKEYSTKFIYYLLKKLRLNDYAEGSSHPLITQNLLNAIDVLFIDDIEEQKSIASILSSLDDKIDLLYQENKTLEAMAETLFRKWFIEEIKEDWKEGTLDDILSVKGGTTPSTKETKYWDGSIPWTSPKDVTTLNGIYLFDTERKITQEGLKQISSGLLPAGTLLMSSRAPVGVLAYAEVPLAINQGYIAIIDDKGYAKEFIYLWLKANMDMVHSYANGSTFMEISKSAFKSLGLLIPPKHIVDEFCDRIKPIFEKIKINELQIRTINKTKDNILPKLMSNEIKIDEL